MKKIMFSDRFGLNAAVLDGSKTMTRRIIPLTAADEEYLDQAFDWDLRESVILDRYAQYEVGEVVAVAKAYKDFYGDFKEPLRSELVDSAGFFNKMFVRADLMPDRIRFTERKIERLRSISAEDCLKEGVKMDTLLGWYYVPNLYTHRRTKYTDRPTMFENPGWAYYNLCKKLRMVLDNSANPWVIAYSFILQKGAEA